jgi:hypothetical protein
MANDNVVGVTGIGSPRKASVNPWDDENNWSLDNSTGLANKAVTNPWDSEKNWSLDNSGGFNKYLPGTAKPTSFLEDAAKWAGDKDNQALVGMGLGASKIGLGLASYLQSSDFMKKQGNLLDQQIANNEYVMNNRKQFSNALANAVNQTK